MVIQNIYSFLALVDPSPMLGEVNDVQRLLQFAQPSIRSVLHCYDHARRWATAVIAEPGIGKETRQRRIERFLHAVELCRALSTKTDGVTIEAPVIRSFVETVLVAAMLSPESRLYQRAWHDAAANRHISTTEALENYVQCHRGDEAVFAPEFKLAVDFGWVIERLVEMISMPDTLQSSTGSLGLVVNFEKRRYVHSCSQPIRLLNLQPQTPANLYSQYSDVSGLSSIERTLTI